MLIKSGLIKSLAATTAFVAAAAAASAALACEQPQGPCGPARMGPPPGAGGPAQDAYIVSPGPTPAYAGREAHGRANYDRYGGEAEHRGGGWGGRYGEVHKAQGYIEPYTPAFGHNVVAERPYDGPGFGYRVEHGACGVCAAPPPPPRIEHRFIERRVHRQAVHHRRHVIRMHRASTHHARVVVREVKTVIIEREREVPRYIERPVERHDEGRVSPDFFYGGINGGAGFGVDGGNWGGGGTVVESGGFAGAHAFASASAHASAHAVAYGHKMSHGGKGCGCGGKGGGGKH